ncbi:MAG: hypothetical protein SPE66_05955, partial [Bilifractor sp.]|nr:hypothetical protein [Bilifractor sp.]
MSYYVFRINYAENFEKIRSELLINHVLRQGWGTYGMRVDQGYEVFRDAWRTEWGTDLSEEAMKTRYYNLSIMTEIQLGDYLIIPKVSVKEDYVCRSFVIARCKGTYRFDVLSCVEDFGHIIDVENVFSCSYDKDMNAQKIAQKFTAYQSPINRVKNSEFIEAVEELVRIHDNEPELFEKESSDLVEMVSNATHDSRKIYLESIVKNLRSMKNHKFEDIIAELFEKNGYKLT